MYDVLLCVDADGTGLDRLVETVTALPAAAESVHVIVCHVFGDNPSGASATQATSVRRALDALDDADIEASVVGESGDPTDAILQVADEHDADTIYIGGRKRSPAGKALFGSVAQSLILSADRPVQITGSGPGA
jgi:nucleotide-binding universal stress UspA family protein